MELSNKKYYSLKAVLAGIVSLAIFGIFSSIFEFWASGFLTGTVISFPQEEVHTSPLAQIYKSNPLFFLLMLIISNMIKFFPTGLIVAFFAKSRFIFHGIIVASFALFFQIIFFFLEQETDLKFRLSILFLNIVITFVMCIAGCIVGSKLLRRRNQS